MSMSGALVAQLSRRDLNALDELGNRPLPRSPGRLLFHLTSKFDEQTGALITADLAFGKWPTVFGDPGMTIVLLDRVTYHCDIVETRNASWRVKNQG